MFLERAGAWLLESGIQEEAGGVARYYRYDEGLYRPVSTEITGYFASICVYLISQTGDSAYLDATRRAARFLTRVAWDEEMQTFPYEYSHDPNTDPPAYFFDCGIIIRGLLAAWRATGEAEFLQIARQCGRSMGETFLTEDGHSAADQPPGRPGPFRRTAGGPPHRGVTSSSRRWRGTTSPSQPATRTTSSTTVRPWNTLFPRTRPSCRARTIRR